MDYIVNIAKDFSQTPGPRNPTEGDFSGEEFLEKVLEPQFQKALAAKQRLIVNLDGVEGYATSFLEASFGGLARKYEIEVVLQNIEYVSNDEPFLKDEILSYIRDARKL